ncbi:MAG: hypothetical protein HOE48_06165, partial [Candidatus Latescibacteria bacterium]|nr:hypothetical protein [Candidatus Latescibacterota bacterium]
MMRKIGTALLWLITIFMLSSVTIFNPGQVTDFFVQLFNIRPSIPELKPIEISERDKNIRSIAESVTENQVRDIVSDLATMGSRVPGYPGHRQAFEYVKAAFEDIGLDGITVETHYVTVPIDKGASLALGGDDGAIALYGLWPNHIQTPTVPAGGVSGKLIYGGKGSFAELNGKEVEGSIVLMDFDCGQSYLNPRMLGAQAIIFFDNGRVTHGEALDKFLQVPVDVPRYWVEDSDTQRLLALANTNTREVTLTGKMEWEKVPSWNIYATLPGTEDYITERKERKWADQQILLSGF